MDTNSTTIRQITRNLANYLGAKGFETESWEEGILHVTLPANSRGRVWIMTDAQINGIYSAAASFTDNWSAEVYNGGSNVEITITA